MAGYLQLRFYVLNQESDLYGADAFEHYLQRVGQHSDDRHDPEQWQCTAIYLERFEREMADEVESLNNCANSRYWNPHQIVILAQMHWAVFNEFIPPSPNLMPFSCSLAPWPTGWSQRARILMLCPTTR